MIATVSLSICTHSVGVVTFHCKCFILVSQLSIKLNEVPSTVSDSDEYKCCFFGETEEMCTAAKKFENQIGNRHEDMIKCPPPPKADILARIAEGDGTLILMFCMFALTVSTTLY